METTATQYKFLARKPGSVYRQLYIKGRRIAARTLYGQYMSAEEPRTLEQIAADYELPLDVVKEAIAYCDADPPEIRQDFAYDEAMIEACGMNDPGYRGQPKRLTSQEVMEIRRRFYPDEDLPGR